MTIYITFSNAPGPFQLEELRLRVRPLSDRTASDLIEAAIGWVRSITSVPIAHVHVSDRDPAEFPIHTDN